MYDKTVVGACSLCGGPVSVPTVWHGVIPPKPTCEKCGAVAVDANGPVIQMTRRTQFVKIITTPSTYSA